MATKRDTGSGWRGGQYRLYREDLMTLDAETIRLVRGELGKHNVANLQTTPRGVAIILQAWRNRGQGDAKTLDFLIQEFERDQGSGQRSLVGMIGFLEELLYDMGTS